MTERSWQEELPRFQKMTQIDQLGWLSQLLYLVSMVARGTYEVGTDGVSKPNDLRRVNELIHRIATFQKKVATGSEQGLPDADLFALVEQELCALGVTVDDALRRLPRTTLQSAMHDQCAGRPERTAMMQKMRIQVEGELAYYYSVRLLIRHPSLLVSEVSQALGMEPHHYWNAGERDFTKSMMWSRTSWTEGQRLFFDEIHDALMWLQGKQDFVSHMRASGGDLQIIVQLPGTINIGDTLSLDALALAAKLGVGIGVEVFPNLVKPASDE